MNSHTDKAQEIKCQSVANDLSIQKSRVESTFEFVDNRSGALSQRKLQDVAGNSPQSKQTLQLQATIDNFFSKQQQSESINVVQCVTQLPNSHKYVRDGLQPVTRLALDTWAQNSQTGSAKFYFDISMEEHNPDQVLLGDLNITIRIDLAALRQRAAAHGGIGVPHSHIEYVDRTQYFIVTRSSPNACIELTDAEVLDVVNNNVLADRIKDWVCLNLSNMPGLLNIDRTWLDEM